MRQFRTDVRFLNTTKLPLFFLMLLAIGLVVTGCESGRDNSGNPPGTPEGSREVSFKTDDGWTIFGDLYAPAGGSKGAVILLHQRDGAAGDWRPLCGALEKAGYTALAIDQRGQGRSVQGPPAASDRRDNKGDNAPWDTQQDIASAISYLHASGPIGLAGASYGANNALIYAAAHPDQIASLVLFSPGIDYHGLQTLGPAKAWSKPLLIFHDKDDTIAGDGPKQIDAATASKDHRLIVTAGSRHGTDLLRDALTSEKTSPVTFFLRTLK